MERRAAELIDLLKQHKDRAKPEPKFGSIGDVAEWFMAEKGKIDGLAIDEDLKDDLRAQLSERYSELTAKIMRKAGT